MLTVEVLDTKAVCADHFTNTPPGESAKLVTNGVVLHPELAGMMPKTTKLIPLTSIGDEHVYHVLVRDYTVEEFRAIVIALMNKEFEKAEELINTLRPKLEWS